ncbi:PQQ-binding-like beta-propeller repeat protein [Flavobacterium algicola]|uniref:PQQ-binding-like beta-propeller repeat protein n=1 Tax=Flavobacterium algicola TaxID=556529 RepID=UPI001EFDC71E|nr:PQQ-binding-like beta-propeller repeat protein [Flavobacterium algicola]MCG9793686.1 PQQ-binding-like beta-propeller repeat protein [Flavobacterium algicola]
MKIKLTFLSFLLFGITIVGTINSYANGTPPSKGIFSIETGYTITKVRTALDKKKSFVVASSYEGTLLGISYEGKILWKNALSGFMNQDIWCQDITGDGKDEILAANSDGTLYCLNADGKLIWQFKKDDTPMYAVCVVKKDKVPYVVCGGFDKSIYYLNADGKEVKQLKSKSYSIEKNSGKLEGKIPENNTHTPNFIRSIPQADGSEVLAILGTNNHMSSSGTIYLFKPLEDQPFRKDKVTVPRSMGDFKVMDLNEDGENEVFLGNSVHTSDTGYGIYYPKTGNTKVVKIKSKDLDTGYLIVQGEKIGAGKNSQLLVLMGDRILLVNPNLDMKKAETLVSKHAFNDVWKDPSTGKIILASDQSGGSCIHIIDTEEANWKKEYININPPGKIQSILKNTEVIVESIKKFKPLAWERKPLPVYFMSENFKTPLAISVSDNIKKNFSSPVFLNSKHMTQVQSPESWNRDAMTNEKYRNKRDRRKKYNLSQQEVLDILGKEYINSPGLATWGGHGNDPYFYSLQTTEKLIDIAAGKKTVLIYPELEDHTDDFQFVLNDLINPLAKYSQGKNTNLFLRTKNIFWLGSIYKPEWKNFMSGEYADVFVPSMEETTDKIMELSLSGRLGIWTSGATNSWGSRAVRDNTSFDRQRQVSYQTIPNHYLRMLVYHISYGATYLDNFPIDQDYMSVLWDLIAKGALYVPKSEEILSFSPVHLAMTEPNENFIQEGGNNKYTTFFDKKYEDENPAVFSRMTGCWPGAQVTPWDFSRYAAGVTDRRLNFLAPYKNGMVLIVPPQKGALAKTDEPRGKLTDHLHPFYKNNIKEYITDGKDYISADGKEKYPANNYYKGIEKDINESAKLLPITVSGEVAWVVAQTAPTHLRLTIIDSGYINPAERLANISFNGVKPVKITDVLTGEKWDAKNTASVKIDVPLGSFRFIDVELEKAF